MFFEGFEQANLLSQECLQSQPVDVEQHGRSYVSSVVLHG